MGAMACHQVVPSIYFIPINKTEPSLRPYFVPLSLFKPLMPISYQHKIIFVHIPKTAGTSIYSLLSIPKDTKHFYSATKSIPCLQHMTPTQLQKRIPPAIWKSFYKFTVVRNPFDRVVSDFRYLRDIYKKNPHGVALPKKMGLYLRDFPSFVQLVKTVVEGNHYSINVYFDHFRPQVHYFSNITYDQVCRFENLYDDIKTLQKNLHWDTMKPLAWKYQTSPIHGPENYRSYYSPRTKKIIERLYSGDLKRFSYSF